MTMSINQLATPSGPDVYYTHGLHVEFESQMKYLREHSETVMVELNPNDVYRFEFDFFGLLDQLGVKRQYHWVIMRVNDFNAPNELTQETTHLLMPSESLLTNIQKLYSTVQANVG